MSSVLAINNHVHCTGGGSAEVGFVLDCAQEDVVNALSLTGQILMGQAIMVKSSEVRPWALAVS